MDTNDAVRDRDDRALKRMSALTSGLRYALDRSEISGRVSDFSLLSMLLAMDLCVAQRATSRNQRRFHLL
jgi:hypothetical protein